MDAVIVWMDTEGKDFRKQLIELPACVNEASTTLKTSRSLEELEICIAALIRNCSQVERIMVVSDKENTEVLEFYGKNFPYCDTKLEFVLHSELFKGFEGYLPCFSQTAIHTLLYRLHRLSENFMLVNIGCIPLEIKDAFDYLEDGNPVYYGNTMKTSSIQNRKNDAVFTGKEGLRNGKKIDRAIELLSSQYGESHQKVFVPDARPAVYSKKNIEKCISLREGLLGSNISHSFDNEQQTDILSILGNLSSASKKESQDIAQITPCSDHALMAKLYFADSCDYFAYAPLSNFTYEQAMAIRDYLQNRLRIISLTSHRKYK